MVTEKHEPAYPNPGEMWNGNKVSLDHLQQLATSTKIFVMKRGHESQMIDRPEFVIVSQTWKHEDLINLGSAAYSRLTVIDLYK